MTAAEFNAALAKARDEMLVETEAPLARIYLRVIRRFGRRAADAYKRQSIVAAGGARHDELYDPDELTREVTQETLRLRRASVERMIGNVVATVGVSFDVAPLLVPSLLDHIGIRARDLNASMQDVLRRTIETAVADGLSVPDTAAAIKAGVNGMAGYTATMLARTDLIGLANGGSIVAAREVLPEGATKTWLSSEDDRVRPTHEDADGQTVPIDAQFEVGDDLLDYPGDPSGSDEEVINCRCTVIYDEEPVTASVTHEEGDMSEVKLEVGAPETRVPVMADGKVIGYLNEVPAVTAAVTDDEAPADDTAEPPMQTWVSDVAFEGIATGDGRFIVPGALTWRTPPLTLMAQTVTADGHDGAEVAGRMDAFFRDDQVDMDGAALPDGVTAIRAVGVFDAGEVGMEIGRMVDDEVLRGVSVDLSIDEWAFRDPATGEILDPNEMNDDQWEQAFFGELDYAILKGEIMAATICPTPAFGDARIAVVASSREGRELTAKVWAPIRLRELHPLTASAAGMAPLAPPREWFTDPGLTELTPLTVTADGRVFGHVAPWNQCHVGNSNRCILPPRGGDYSMFHLGTLTCDDGSEVSVGQITMDTGHASAKPGTSARAALAHYDNTGTAVADVRVGEDSFGPWMAGAIRPDLSAEKLRAFRAAKVSGDWRPVNGHHELTGILTVNQPGFPVPRKDLVVVTASGVVVAAGVPTLSGGDGDTADPITLRVLAARADGGMDALAEIAR